MEPHTIWQLIKAGKWSRKRFRGWRNKVRAEKGLPLKGATTMKNLGWVTNSGLLTIVIGLAMNILGVGDCIPNAEGVCENAGQIATQVGAAIDQILVGGGSVVGLVGRARTARKLSKLQAIVDEKQLQKP